MGQPPKLELMIGPTDCGLLLAAGTAGAAVRSLAWMLQLRGANWGPNQFSQAHRPSAAVRMQSGLKEVRRSVDTKCWDETVSRMRGGGAVLLKGGLPIIFTIHWVSYADWNGFSKMWIAVTDVQRTFVFPPGIFSALPRDPWLVQSFYPPLQTLLGSVCLSTLNKSYFLASLTL